MFLCLGCGRASRGDDHEKLTISVTKALGSKLTDDVREQTIGTSVEEGGDGGPALSARADGEAAGGRLVLQRADALEPSPASSLTNSPQTERNIASTRGTAAVEAARQCNTLLLPVPLPRDGSSGRGGGSSGSSSSIDAEVDLRLEQEDAGAAGESSRPADGMLLPLAVGEVTLKQPRLSTMVASAGMATGRGEQQPMQRHPTLVAAAEIPFDGDTAAQLALLPSAKLLPLARPEAALGEAAAALQHLHPGGATPWGVPGSRGAGAALAALLTLRRLATHHPALLLGCLDQVMHLLLGCCGGGTVGRNRLS